MTNLKTKIFFYNQKGEGVGFYQEKPIYLPHTILGEEVEFEVIQELKNYSIGRVVAILEPSIDRVNNLPKDYQLIGGYELIHMNLKAEEAYKKYVVMNDFKSNAKIKLEEKDINYFQGLKEFRYRNKITLENGYFKIKNTNDYLEIDDFLLTAIPYQNNKRKGKVIYRQLDDLIIGTKKDVDLFTTDTIEGITFRVNIASFYQINKEVAEEAYKQMLSFLDKKDKVWDLYSGIGTITLLASKKAQEVIGVERSRTSHRDAIFNKEYNKISNVEFVNQDVLKFLQTQDNLDGSVICDPAREGLKKEVCHELLRLEPKRIIYLSCNPATQAADINILKEKYNISFIKIFNMFPKTYHIENLVVLDLKI